MGHAVLTVTDALGEGATDDAIYALLRKQAWILVTTNYHHFGDVKRYPPEGTGGIIVLRGKGGAPFFCTLLETFLGRITIDDILGNTVAVSETGYRITNATERSGHVSFRRPVASDYTE